MVEGLGRLGLGLGYLFGEGKDLVPALFAELVEELRAGDVRVVF